MTQNLLPAPDTVRVPRAMVLGSMVGLWLCYYVLTTIRGLVVGIDLDFETLWRRGAVSAVGMLFTIALWWCLRLVDRRSLGIKIAVVLLVSIPASLAIAQVNQWVFAPLEPRLEERFGKEKGIALRRDQSGNLFVDVPADAVDPVLAGAGAAAGPGPRSVLVSPAPTPLDRLREVVDGALGRYFLLLTWAALYLALLEGAQAQAAQGRVERFRLAAKAAELRSLRYQVNPHFLFNTLNSLSALVMTGKTERAEQMIDTIARFYRHSLAEDSTGDVTLEDELDLQEHYLAIESVRFPDRLRVKVDLPRELANCMVPGMILQPLVENSVKYGVSASAQPVTISVVAREEYDRLVITVSDDGPGKGGSAGLGIGLTNVRDRIEARFGESASLVSGPLDRGYRTELRLPLVRHG